jgi:hypothetical protein
MVCRYMRANTNSTRPEVLLVTNAIRRVNAIMLGLAHLRRWCASADSLLEHVWWSNWADRLPAQHGHLDGVIWGMC